MEFPREMIEEFLVRLPLKSVTKFKCVSKDWNNLISGVEFRRWYQSRHRNTCPIGFVFHPIRISQSSIDIEPAKFVISSNIDKKANLGLYHDLQEFGEVIGSSKGLILISLSSNNTNYYVYDLLTRNHVQLPEINTHAFMVTGFFCKEHEQSCANNIIGNSSYLTYKVVRIATNVYRKKATEYKVQTYSSETGKWHKSMMTTASEFCFDPQQRTTTVIRGVLYWWNFSFQYITAYDPEDPLGCAKLIEIPISNSLKKLTISSTQDGRLLCMRELESNGIDVWILGKKYERGRYLDEDIINHKRWILFHKISDRELTKSLLDSRPSGPTWYQSVGFHHQDSSIIYLRMAEEFISYNLEKKRVETIILKGKEIKSIVLVKSYIHLEWPSWPCLK